MGKDIEEKGYDGVWRVLGVLKSIDFDLASYRVAQPKKSTITLYQWLCKDMDRYYVGLPMESKPAHAVKRLDHTRLEMEVDDE